jgi:signal transduction histidine kinase
MNFRSILAVVLFIALAAFSAFVLISIVYMRGQVSMLFPADLALEVDHALQTLFIGQAALLFAFQSVLVVIVFWILGSLVTRPLRKLSIAMDSYGKMGTREPIENISEAPKEIRDLAASFAGLIERVDESHKHDEEISRVKSDFISTAAHQFRTPLTGIRWALEALEKETLTESQKALVQSAVDKSKDLVSIVGTLLDISAIESGKYKYTFIPVDMTALLQELVNDFMPLSQKNQVSLFFAFEEGVVLPNARADRERIKWVLNNLIENALTYTPAEGTVRVSIEGSEQRLFIRVKDTGIGISNEDRANIFERFYRAQNAITLQNKGNGLGLYIARTIATDHGGDLNFAGNKDGPGTTFTLSLPISE